MSTTTTTPKTPSQRQMRRNIRAEHRLAAETPAIGWAHWYETHHETLTTWAIDHDVDPETAIAAAATLSPGMSPDVEPEALSWVLACVRADVEPSTENRPHGMPTPYGYAPFKRAAEVLRGDRAMPSEDKKTGNYGRAIADPADPRWCAVDVWAWRTTCGDPIDSTRPLANLTPTEYREVRRAWQAVAEEHGLTASGLQAVCWVYRRGRP